MSRLSRRNFLKTIPAVSAGVAGLTRTTWSQPLGANGDVRTAVVGFHGMGKSHIRAYQKMKGVRIVALCDVDKDVIDWGIEDFKKRNEKVKTYIDVRALLDDPEIDAISVVTPNHWHSLITVWACQAGKDVTVEKPISHNIFEGRKCVEAGRKYNRIVQADFDLRSREGLHEAIRWVQAGNLGKILVARGFIYKRRASIGKVKGPQPIPRNIVYDLWTGPASLGPLMRRNLHYDWHWVWPTGCGELGNNGPHQLDVCRWALGQNALPKHVFSLGGRFGYDDDGETPNTQIAWYDYEPAPLIYEFRGLPRGKSDPASGQGATPGGASMDNYLAVGRKGKRFDVAYGGTGVNHGVVIECECGYLDTGRLTAFDYEGRRIKEFEDQSEGPQANFIKAVRSRKREDLRSDILEGHLSTSLSHMGNISYRVGAQSSPGEIQERVRGNREMNEGFGRFEEHLAANGIDLKKTQATLGPVLEMDPATERFTGEFANEANQYISRDYRKPFVVPEKV